MNYKIQRLVEYGVFLLNEDSPFIRKVFHEYFALYVDNYYYHQFYTVDTTTYSLKNLLQEFETIGLLIFGSGQFWLQELH